MLLRMCSLAETEVLKAVGRIQTKCLSDRLQTPSPPNLPVVRLKLTIQRPLHAATGQLGGAEE